MRKTGYNLDVALMRARNIKPSLFKNEFLATSDPLNTVIFAGLWCLADRDGRLEDRPRRIHLEINPGRAYEGTEAALAWLDEQRFIVRYAHGDGQYIQVVNFSKHQNPHVREPASGIAPPGASIGQELYFGSHISPSEPESSTVLAPDQHSSGPALSPSLIPDSPSPFPDTAISDSAEFETFKALYPKRNGSNPWTMARRSINARLSEGFTWENVLDGTRRYAAWCKSTGKLNTEHVMQAARFCGPGAEFNSQWDLPDTKPKHAPFVPPPDDKDEDRRRA